MSRYSFVIVTRPGDGLGFLLAGARVEEVAPGEEHARLGPLLAEPGLGVLAVEEQVIAGLSDEMLDLPGRVGLPVVFPFALPRRLADPSHTTSYIGELLRRAIGYHVRLG